MKSLTGLIAISTLFFLLVACDINTKENQKSAEPNQMNSSAAPMKLQIIIGSVRLTRTCQKIANNIKAMIDKRQDVAVELVDIAEYNLPFYTDVIMPASREGEIPDPVLRKWSDKIKEGEAYIIVAPQYNKGYPGPLKNALDSLYQEWNGKPVAFVGYSGGKSGGKIMIEQLRLVADELEMIAVDAEVKIPRAAKALNEQGVLIESDAIEKEINVIVNQLLQVHNQQ